MSIKWKGFGDYPTTDDPNVMDHWAEIETPP